MIGRTPLAVRLVTSRADLDITKQVEDLVFRSVVPGGFASAQFRLKRPIKIQNPDLAYYAQVFVYDGRTGLTVWEGRVEDLGRGAGTDGAVWDIAAVGPSAHASDMTIPRIYVDSSLERWKKSGYSTGKGDAALEEIDDNTPAVVLRPVEGNVLAINYNIDFIYRELARTGQVLGRIRADADFGSANGNMRADVVNRVDAGGGSSVDSRLFSAGSGVVGGTYGSSNWVDGQNVTSLRVTRLTTSVTATDNLWGRFATVCVVARRKTAAGVAITSAYTVNNVDPNEVVNDLLGDILSKYDGANARVDSSGYDIDQFAYPDGATPAQMMEDLMVLDPDYYWAAWETNQANGRWRFEWRQWPTSIRYEAEIFDGFTSPGSASDLYNLVTVRWLDAHGRVRNAVSTASVPILSAAGLTRQYFIDLSNEVGSLANASRTGLNFLAEHASPPNAGTLIIARPTQDYQTGRMVQPWEIRPGFLIRVRGVVPRVDALNATARDGVTVFKVVATTFNVANASVELELDSNPKTVAHTLRKVTNRRFRKA